MPSFADAIAIAQTAIQANLPTAAVDLDDLLYNVIVAVAAVVDAAYDELAQTAAQMSLLTATGGDLDALVNQIGIYRIPGLNATGSVVFTLTPGPTTAQVVPAGTVVSTASNPATYFVTNAPTTIPVPGTPGNPSSSPSVGITAQVAGASGNVLAGTIQLVNFQVTPGVLGVANAAATSGGADPESDEALRDRGLAATEVKYGATDLTAAALAVSGVFDAWILDQAAPVGSDNNPSGPQTATGGYSCYWCASDGTQPGAGSPPTGTALAVLNALIGVQPPGVISTLAAFTVVTVTTVAVNYRVAAGVSPSLIVPLMQQGVVNYLQSLQHNKVPDVFTMSQYVQTYVGGGLLLFLPQTLNGSSFPAISSASHTTIYRCTGSPSSVVTCTPI